MSPEGADIISMVPSSITVSFNKSAVILHFVSSIHFSFNCSGCCPSFQNTHGRVDLEAYKGGSMRLRYRYSGPDFGIANHMNRNMNVLGFWNNSGSSYKYSYRPRMTTGSEGSVDFRCHRPVSGGSFFP